MVEGGDQESGRSGSGVIDRLADLRVHYRHDGPDNVPRRAELTKFTRLLDLLQDVFEQVALGVGVGFIEPQPINQRQHLRKHDRFINDEPGAVHEVDGGAVRHLRVEGEYLITNKRDQPGPTHAARPLAPAQAVAGNGSLPGGWGVQRVFQRPGFARKNAGIGPLRRPCAVGVVLIQPLNEIEKKIRNESCSALLTGSG